MTLYVLDTDTCSFIMRERPIEVLTKMQEQSFNGHEITISSITYAELLLGAERSAATKKYIKLIEELVKRLDGILPWDKHVAETYAKLQSSLFKKGKPIGANDTMIASHALSVDGTLVTNNIKHFKKVPKLKIENWAHQA